MSEVQTILKKYYYDSEIGFLSGKKLYQKLQSDGIKNISLKTVTDFVNNQAVSQITKQTQRPKQFNTVFSFSVGNNIQSDVIIYDRFEWNKYKYIFVSIDVYSRKLYCVPMTNRRAETLVDALEKTFKVLGIPKNFNADQEFNIKLVNDLMKKDNIQSWYSDPYALNHNPIVERANRTIAQLLQRYRIATKNYNWPEYLPKLINNYNNTIHGTTNATPNEIFDGKKRNRQIIIRLKPKFK